VHGDAVELRGAGGLRKRELYLLGARGDDERVPLGRINDRRRRFCFGFCGLGLDGLSDGLLLRDDRHFCVHYHRCCWGIVHNDRLDDRNRIRTEWKKCRRTGRLDNARPVGKREQEDRLQREEEEQQERGRHHTERVGEGKREN
jgi:hypothetical protein